MRRPFWESWKFQQDKSPEVYLLPGDIFEVGGRRWLIQKHLIIPQRKVGDRYIPVEYFEQVLHGNAQELNHDPNPR